ncbi:hypothetical protein D3C71_1987330 [compost metagenome]
MVREHAGRALALVEHQSFLGQHLGGVPPFGPLGQAFHGVIGINQNAMALPDKGRDAKHFEPAQRAVPEADDCG